MPQKNKYSTPQTLRVPALLHREMSKLAKKYRVPRSQVWLATAAAFASAPPKTLETYREKNDDQNNVFE